MERLGRSALKDDKLPDDLLILSCEEDYEICEPFLEKGQHCIIVPSLKNYADFEKSFHHLLIYLQGQQFIVQSCS